MSNFIAVDMGAESGRVILGSFLHNKLELTELGRFETGAQPYGDSIRWDIDRIFDEICTGIGKACEAAKGEIAGIAVDSWGVDYGLLDSQGKLIDRPYHYRDSRTNGMLEKVFAQAGRREVYDNSGIQFMQLNTLYQIYAAKEKQDASLAKAKTMLFIADLVRYFLCGDKRVEYTLASTSQIMDMRTGTWSQHLINKLGLPGTILPEYVQAGTVVGQLKQELAKRFNVKPFAVIAAGSHDTACAVAAVPAKGNNWAYLSSGTWSLMGVEVPKPVINDKTYEYQFTNEGGVCNTIRLLKNIMGLWILQECRRHWQTEGTDLNYEQIAKMATDAKPFAARIDPNYSEFLAPGDMPAKINRYLASTGQPQITDKGQMARIILESLALAYRQTIQMLESLSGPINTLHVVGGGIKNELLCQFTADSTGKKVIAGPVEATAMGNILLQAMALGEVKSLEAARAIVRNSVNLKEYVPQSNQQWLAQYNKYYGSKA
ncbi:MAG: hypothetical protein A2Y07_06000 [Planctomycetes bacterium GWF2_50_10]|nr:MAG: hypothetical protein A2Y07_06000 [Planctomycetes bacterium GWF2_50_10]